MSKHTPLPWHSQPSAGHETHGQSIIYGEGGNTIAVVYGNDADCELIGRAVNNHDGLVEALTKLLEHEGERDVNGVGMESDSDMLERTKQQAREALTAARGETPQ